LLMRVVARAYQERPAEARIRATARLLEGARARIGIHSISTEPARHSTITNSIRAQLSERD
jgi:hypothetical protein